MTLQQLSYFLAAAENGSFSAAANALLMSQPSLSDQIRRLEAELGVPLFVRAGRGVELTDAGRILRPYAERVLAEAQEALESVREVRDLTGGAVAFGFFCGAPHSILRDIVQEFHTRHPAVRLRAVGQNSAEVADAVREGILEAGLVILPVDDVGLEVRRVSSEELLYVSADPKRTRQPMTIERLAEAPLILYDARWAAQDPARPPPRGRAQPAGGRDGGPGPRPAARRRAGGGGGEGADRGGRVHARGLPPRRPRPGRHDRLPLVVAHAPAPHDDLRPADS